MTLARIDGTLKVACDAMCDVVETANSPEETKKTLGDRLLAEGWKFASGWHFCATHSGVNARL
jgi:hypothetical protein